MYRIPVPKIVPPNDSAVYSAQKLYAIYVQRGQWLYFKDKKKAAACAVALCNYVNETMILYFNYLRELRAVADTLYFYYGNDKIYKDIEFCEMQARKFYRMGPGWVSYGGGGWPIVYTGSKIIDICAALGVDCTRRRLMAEAHKLKAIAAACAANEKTINDWAKK